MAKQQIVSYIDRIDVFRVNVLLHADLIRNTGTVIIAGEESTWTIAGALEYLAICTEAIRNASRQQSKRRAAAKLLVFCTEMDVLRPLIIDKLGSVDEIGSKSKYGKRYANYFATANILFANANIIANNPPQKVHELFRAGSVAQSVEQILTGMHDEWHKIRWSLAHHTQAEFYRPIKEELWAEMCMQESAYYYTADSYRDMLIGNKGGAIALFDGEAGRYQRQILTNIISIDKRSAYPAVMVSDSCYPLHQIERVKQARVETLGDMIRSRQWCKVVIRDTQPAELMLWYDAAADAIGMDIYDILLCIRMHKMQALLNALEAGTWSLYISTERVWADSDIDEHDAPEYQSEPCGYLSDILRRELVIKYNLKEQFSRGTPERHNAKTQIDMICGKGLQPIHAGSARALNRALRGRGERYIRPQHSMHTIAAVRLELYTLIETIAEQCGTQSVVAFDTDCIKVKDSQTVRSIIEEHNSRIIERNRLAGYDTDIGTWCIEYTAKRFLQIGTKQYIYIDKDTGELVTKSAGIPKIDLMHAIKGLRMTPEHAIEYIAQHKIPVDRRRGFVYDPDTQSFIEQRETVMF